MLSSPQFPRISTPLFYIQSNSSATCSHVARVNSKNRLCCSWRRLLERVDNRRIIYSGLSWCETCFYMMHSSRHKRFTFLERTTGAENITLWYSAQCSMYRFWYTKLCHAFVPWFSCWIWRPVVILDLIFSLQCDFYEQTMVIRRQSEIGKAEVQLWSLSDFTKE